MNSHFGKAKRIIPVLVVLTLLVGGYYLWSNGLLPGMLPTGNNNDTVSGFIEGDEYKIASEITGRVRAVHADQGDRVTAGQTLVELDTALIEAQIAQAQSALKTEQAQFNLVQNPASEADKAAAQAAVNAAQENLDKLKAGADEQDLVAAQTALHAAQENYDKLLAGPKSADLAAAQAALNAARQAYDKVKAGPTADQLAGLQAQADNALAAVNQAQAAYDQIGGASNPNIAQTPQSRALEQATNLYRAAVSAYNDALTHPTAVELAAAQAQVDSARAALERLTPDNAQLTFAKAAVDQAKAALSRLTPDVPQLAAAQAQLDNARAVQSRLSPTQETLSLAQARVNQAQAALDVLKVQLARTTIVAPADGIVTQRAVNPGEIASPGAALLLVSQLDPVELTIYVPETRLGDISLGSEIGVQVDSFPGRTFPGKIINIADRAEFTPRNVQTQAERVSTVFAVKLQIPNPNLELKPGMPADAALP